MQHLLINFYDDAKDHRVQGFYILNEELCDEECPTLEKLWERIVSGFPTEKVIEVYYGDNEGLSYRSKEEYVKCFTTKSITDDEVEMLRSILGIGKHTNHYGLCPIVSDYW